MSIVHSYIPVDSIVFLVALDIQQEQELFMCIHWDCIPLPFYAEDERVLNLIKVMLRITCMSLSFTVEIIMLNYNVFHKPLVLINTCGVYCVKNITTVTFI